MNSAAPPKPPTPPQHGAGPALPFIVRWFARWPMRYAIPLVVLLAVLPLCLWINIQSWSQARHNVEQATQTALLDRLHLEQARLEAQLNKDLAQNPTQNATQNPDQRPWLGTRRLVSAWGLYPGISHAWLVDGQGWVLASLSRRDVGQSLDTVLQNLAHLAPVVTLHREEATNTPVRTAHTHLVSAPQSVLLGHVSIYPQHHLLVQVDNADAVARAWNTERLRMLREGGALLLVMALFAWLLHRTWVRRMEHLEATATALGQGHWQARTGMRESDELGRIGQAMDRMAQTLQQQHLHQHTVANASPVLLWMSGLDKNAEWFNERWLAFTGRSLAQELGNGWTEVVHPDDLARCLALNQRAFEAQQAFSMEYRLRRHDGSYRWMLNQGMPRLDGQGAFVGFMGSCLDITETKALEAQVLAQADYFRVLVEHAPSFIALLDTEGRRQYVNPAYRRILGEERTEPGELPWDDVHPDDRLAMREVFQKTVNTGVGQTARYRLLTRDGQVRHVSSHGGVIRQHDGQIIQVVVVSHDVTAQVQAEEHLRQLNAELEQRVAARTAELQAVNHALESFVYAVSHDLKAPLRGVEGYSRLLQHDHQDHLNDEGRWFVAQIRTGVHRMEQLIDDLLTYSRMERRHLELRPLRLAEQVAEALAFVQPALAVQHTELSTRCDSAEVCADATGLALVLRNLLGNAIKFSAQVSAPHIEVGCQQHDSVALLWVRDNGVGFDMKYHDRIFDMFQRLHRQEAFPGTGIGLALVKKAVERMGGRVWADSTPGAGATFWLELPLAQRMEPGGGGGGDNLAPAPTPHPPLRRPVAQPEVPAHRQPS
jgi:PAS domain S-box-containing protein